MSDQRNLLFAVVLSMVVVFGWQYLVGVPKIGAGAGAPAADHAGTEKGAGPRPAERRGRCPRGAQSSSRCGAGAVAAARRHRNADARRLDQSDRRALRRFALAHLSRDARSRRAPKSSCSRRWAAEHPYFAEFGWIAQTGSQQPVPGATTQWKLAQGDKLSPGHDIELAYDNGQGLTFTRHVSVDQNYMFTIIDSVDNHGADARDAFPLWAGDAPQSARRHPLLGGA